MSTSARRRPPKAPAPPIDLDEIEQDPGFRGMLSFLEVSPSDRGALLALRSQMDTQSPMGEPLAGKADDPVAAFPAPVLPMGDQAMGDSPADDLPVARTPPIDDRPATADDLPTGQPAMGQLPMGLPSPGVVPYMDVEGRGKRPLRYCRTAQDGHTSSEHLAYQALWDEARKHGRAEPSGSSLLDIGLSQLCPLLDTDHKNVKRLLGSLQEKLAIEMVRQPDYRLAMPAPYRIFNDSQILERRRSAGLLWVIRTRTIRFVDLATVTSLLAEQSTGERPMGISGVSSPAPTPSDLPVDYLPMGHSPITSKPAAEFPVSLGKSLNQWIAIEDNAVRRIWDACRRGDPDCTEEEVDWFCRSRQTIIQSGRIDNPIGLLLRSVPQFFANGGSAPLDDCRKERSREQDRERRRERQMAQMVLADPESA